MARWGYETRRVAHQIMQVDLEDSQIILNEPVFDDIIQIAQSKEEFRALVLQGKDKTHEDWQRERGPDSALGRNMEAGTPTTDHSSEPQ